MSVMINKKGHVKYIFYITASIVLSIQTAQAQTLPGTADPARIEPLEQLPLPDKPAPKTIIPDVQQLITIPDAAKDVRFILQHIRLEGVTAFSDKELSDIYQPYLHQEITLDVIWIIAGKITEYYQQQGYFLSRAFVPAQEIENGYVTIKVVEGYISEVDIDDETLISHSLIQRYISRIRKQKPVSAYALESFMLQINALPGLEFRAVVEPIENAEDGVTRLSLQRNDEAGTGIISYDNFGSRFLGPYQATVTYQNDFIPLQQTTFSLLTSTPADELKYAAFQHSIPFYPDIQFDISGNYVTAEPGSLLAPNDIASDSMDLGLGFSWQPIRQRQENLIITVELTGKNTNGDILGNNPLTRDRIRAARARINYNAIDAWYGYNLLTFSIHQGTDIFGASDPGDIYLSRAEANPEFTATQFSYTRQQVLYGNIAAIGKIAGQVASDPLFSAEEFGYGGQIFGRAYDPSELIGDHGIAASLELYASDITQWNTLSFSPYGFYDIGKVWNEDTGGIDESASSAGFGMRIKHPSGISSNLGLAWPLTRSISTPIYGNGKNPRILFQLSYGF